MRLAALAAGESHLLQVTLEWSRWRPREHWLDVLPEYVVHRYALHERRVDIDGDCACVLQRAEIQATSLGEDRSGQFMITDI
jgi:hypothetical protein